MFLIRNANIYAPEQIGLKDILICNGSIIKIEDHIPSSSLITKEWNADGKITTPGFIDQHIHTIGAGGKNGFPSMTPEIMLHDLIECGSTTVVGLLGTDGTIRNLRTLYGKSKGLDKEGITAYMFTGYFGLDSQYLMNSVQEDMIFIDKVLGCKIALSDVRSSFPTARELLNILREVRVGGMIGSKKGILHVHLGNLDSKMDILFELVQKYQFPITHISPTHVGRTKDLFMQAIEFGKLGAMIDITTGATKYTDPFRSVIEGMDQGLSINQMTFSSDGNAGLEKVDTNGKRIGFRRAPIDTNYKEVIALVKTGGVPLESAIRLITTNPAINLGLEKKGRIQAGGDADLCFMDEDLRLTDVFAKGVMMMENNEILVNGSFQ